MNIYGRTVNRSGIVFCYINKFRISECVLFTMVWRITRWTRDRQSLPSPIKLRAYRDGPMGKAETSHTSHTPIPLLKGGQ